MTIRRTNPRKQGEIGLGAAIAWFLAEGYAVSVPLCDNQPYDLVVDGGQGLLRVQVKTTTQRGPTGNFFVQICTRGGNRSAQSTKYWDPAASDILFVLTDDGDVYMIPSDAIKARTTISLCAKYEHYRCSRSEASHPGSLVVGGGFEPP